MIRLQTLIDVESRHLDTHSSKIRADETATYSYFQNASRLQSQHLIDLVPVGQPSVFGVLLFETIVTLGNIRGTGQDYSRSLGSTNLKQPEAGTSTEAETEFTTHTCAYVPVYLQVDTVSIEGVSRACPCGRSD